MRTSVAVATFLCLWFITLFAVLPFFAHTQDDAGTVVPGTPESAPANIRLLRIFLINTLVAAIVFSIVYAIIANFETVSFYVMSALRGLGLAD